MSRNVRMQANLRLRRQVSDFMAQPVEELCGARDIQSIASDLSDLGVIGDDQLALLSSSGVVALADTIGLHDAYQNFLHNPQPKNVEIIDVLARKYARREREHFTDIVADALTSRGMTIAVAYGDQVNAIEAWLDDDLILVTIRDFGDISIAQSAASGNCADHLNNVEHDLSDRGLETVRVSTVEHEGASAVISLAASAGKANLAQAIVDAETPLPASRRGPRTSSKARKITVTGQER